MGPRWWSPDGVTASARFALEVKTVQRMFPEGGNVKVRTSSKAGWPKEIFRVRVVKCAVNRRKLKNDGAVVWDVEVEFLKSPGFLQKNNSPSNYRFTITCSGDYPNDAPAPRIITELRRGVIPHLMQGDTPCLYYPEAGREHGWDPARSTVATMIGWVIEWLTAYRVWCVHDYWPGKSAD